MKNEFACFRLSRLVYEAVQFDLIFASRLVRQVSPRAL